MARAHRWFAGTILGAALILGALPGVAAPEPRIQLESDPRSSRLQPFEAEATVHTPPPRLTVVVADAPPGARLHLQILAPPPTPWLSTDFPMVEGAVLFDIETPLPRDGRWQIRQSLPIRGTYRLPITVTGSGGTTTRVLTLAVDENPQKYWYFGVLAGILLVAGLGGGWVIGARAPLTEGETAPRRVRLLLSGAGAIAIAALLAINLSAETGETHDHGSHAEGEEQSSLVQTGGLTVQWIPTDHATVGQPLPLSLRVTDTRTSRPVADVDLAIEAIQTEEHWLALAFRTSPDPDGWLRWQEQFFDGAPHRIEVTVSSTPGSPRRFAPFRLSRTIDVEAVAPPLATRLLTLAYFTGLLVIGLLVGLGLRSRLSFGP